jgi:transcriptional antiterminator NusG
VQQKVASASLESKGYEQFLPTYRKWDSHRGAHLRRPLFPGYVFCRFDMTRRLPILTTPGVLSVIGFGEPVPIPDTEIESVQAVLRSGRGAEPCPFLNEGQRVRLNRGSLQGVEGIVIRKKGEWRVVVSVTMLQRSVSVDLIATGLTSSKQPACAAALPAQEIRMQIDSKTRMISFRLIQKEYEDCRELCFNYGLRERF